MSLGNWVKAIIKAIFITSLIAPVFFLVWTGIPSSLDELSVLAVILLIFYINYLLMSAVGWACVGFPTHWLICKYSNGRLVWYVLAVALITLAMSLIFQHPVAFIYGAAALIQVLLFKYYVYKPAKM